MTGQEQQMLNDLVQKVNQTNLQEKDNDAEQLLNNGLGRNPDAVYVLAQTVLVQNLALDQARQQLMAMRQQAQQQPAKPTSFLGGLFGHHDAPPQPQAQYQPVQPQYAQPQQQYAQQPVYQAPPSGQPSFLRSAATTAAGVAGGMLAFQGVEDLLHGGMGGGGFGGYGGGFGGDAPREEIVNNYYGSPGGEQGGQGQGNDPNWIAGPDEQQQGPFDNGGDQGGYDAGQDAGNYGDDYTDGGGDFGGDDDSNFS